MVLKLCPSKTRLLLALVEYRQPRANSNNPVRETLLAPGFPRQYGAIDPDATLRRPALPGERSPVGLFAFCWGLGSCATHSAHTTGVEMTGCGFRVRQAGQLTVVRVMPNSACFSRRGLWVGRFDPAIMTLAL
ncbi:hypothetical protein TcG_05564 [Trypanosoma cruzi]|nr:hypothetical protein TcBrA4_0136110 [Trypanosoma cruzi]RNF17447.1 hypothetical protein TcG_05564 [Trypanosoma cruzi]